MPKSIPRIPRVCFLRRLDLDPGDTRIMDIIRESGRGNRGQRFHYNNIVADAMFTRRFFKMEVGLEPVQSSLKNVPVPEAQISMFRKGVEVSNNSTGSDSLFYRRRFPFF